MESKKLYFFFLSPRYPSFLFVECCFPTCMCVKARTSDIHLGQKQRKMWSKNSAKKIIRNYFCRKSVSKKKKYECMHTVELFFCVLLLNYLNSYIRWLFGMFESQSLTVLAITRRFLQHSILYFNSSFFLQKSNQQNESFRKYHSNSQKNCRCHISMLIHLSAQREKW